MPAAHEVSFAHPSERHFAELLDFYRVRWEYEPHTFVLQEGHDGLPLAGFTPDFYLPDHDVFIELTTMRQALVTRKNRKVREFRKRYPDRRITVLYTRDVDRLRHKYGLEQRGAA